MKSFWENTEIKIGTVVENTETKLFFQATEDIPAIKNIVPGCGCSTFRFDHNSKKLHITYKAGKIPYHLNKEQFVSKHFGITYTDGTHESLVFTGKKVKS